MEICRQNESLEIRELDPFLAELLRQIPDSVETKNSPAAEERLLSAPAEAKETEFRSEWKLYVVPELRRLFQSSTETVRQDLEQLHCTKKPFANCTLKIPLAHADAWLNALNQAADSLGAHWKKDGDFIEGRAAAFFWDKLKEVPNRLLDRWQTDSERNAGLPLNDLLQMALLSDQQLDSKFVQTLFG